MCSQSENTRARSEEHTSELQSPYVISYAVFCLKKKRRLASQSPTAWSATRWPSSTSAAVSGSASRSAAACALVRPADYKRPSAASFFFNDTATTEIYTLSLHDALPI